MPKKTMNLKWIAFHPDEARERLEDRHRQALDKQTRRQFNRCGKYLARIEKL
jgi:hypothetical protein